MTGYIHIEKADYGNFNSHAHVERDHSWMCYNIITVISTHTLTWSVTLWFINETKIFVFQLTRSRGAWQAEFDKIKSSDDFNSHAHVERDDFGKKAYKPRKYFNSHAHVERDF